MPPPLELNVSQPLPVEDSRHASPPVIYIKRSRGLVSLRLGELWRYRELLYFLDLARREGALQADRAGRRLGGHPAASSRWWSSASSSAGWPRCRPTGCPYPLFALRALVPWTFFANGLTQSSNSLVDERESDHEGVLPAAGHPDRRRCSRAGRLRCRFAGAARDDGAATASCPTIGRRGCRCSCCWRSCRRRWRRLWLSALNVAVPRRAVHDPVPDADLAVRHRRSPTPAAWSRSAVATLYGLNPMAGVVEGFRWALLGTADCRSAALLIVVASASLVLLVPAACYLPPHGADVRGRGVTS